MPSPSKHFDSLWELVVSQLKVDEHSIHGPQHWRRVERNGLLLAAKTGADVTVVRLFALFHDSRRANDLTDEGHGARGAAYAAELRGVAYDLDDEAFASLEYACVWHTDQDYTDDPTIGTCWDADRLDLGRVGITPSEKLMNTAFGREIAKTGSLYSFLGK